MKICKAVLKVQSKAMTLEVGKSELRFMCSTCRLMALNVCVKFHENISSSFKVMKRTQNCELTKGKNSISRKTRVSVLVFCMSSYRA